MATFLDLGASKGGSLRFATKIFGGTGKGVDVSEKKIAQLRHAGLDGIVGDVTTLSVNHDKINYVTMMNFLEHLPNQEVGKSAIDNAVQLSSDFVYMLGPNFSHRRYLHQLGFRKYFTKWSGHTWEHTTDELAEIVSSYSSYDTVIVEFDRIKDSADNYIIPVNSPKNSGKYDEQKHGHKVFKEFAGKRINKWIAFAISKNDRISAESVLFRAIHAQGIIKNGLYRNFYE